MFPQMVQGYTDEGNAIIAHKGNVEELTKAYEEQKKAAEDALITSGSDIYKSFKNQTKEKIFGLSDNLVGQKDILNDFINKTDDEIKKSAGLSNIEYDALKKAGIDLSWWDHYIGQDSQNLNKVVENRDKIFARVRQLTTEINAETAKVKPVLSAYVESDPDYNKLDEKTQNIADRIIGGLGVDYIKSAGNDIDLYAKVINDIIEPLQDANLSNEFNTVFDLQTQFNNNEITVNDYQNKLNAFLSLIENLDPEVKKSILLLFGIETNEDGTTTSDINAMWNNVKDKLQDEFDNKVGDLTFGDLKIAADNIEVPKDSLLTWDELIAKIKEVKALNAEDSNVLLTDLKSSTETLSVLQSALSEMNEEGNVSIGTLASIQEKFSNVKDVDKYINALSKAKKGSKEFNDNLTKLTYAYLESQYSAEDLANVDESLLATMLRSAGVSNAAEIAQYAIARAKEQLRIETELLNATSEDAVLALINEAKQCGITKQSFLDLILTTGIFNNTNLNVQQKINALMELGYWANWSKNQIDGISNVKRFNRDGRDVIAAYDKDGRLISLENTNTPISSDFSDNAPTPKYVNKNTAKKQEDLAKQIREKEKQIEEAWEKERLEQLKDDLEKRKNEIEKYKNYIETLDFGLDILDSSDYSGQVQLLEQKHESIVGYEQQLRDEMSRVLQIQYTTADEAQAIASRIQEIGSEMSNNKKILKETIVEMQKANIEAARAATIDVTSNLTDGLERSMWMLEKLDNPYNRNKDFLNRMMSFDSLFGEVSELDKELEKRKKHDKELIAEEQKTQDTIHQIVTDALKLQAEENAKTRAEERAKLEEELAEISKEYKSTLDTAAANTENTKNKITGSFNSVADSAGTMQQNVDTYFENMENSVANHADNMIEKLDELSQKLYNPNEKLTTNTTKSNSKNEDAIAQSVLSDYKRISSPYGNRIHPITGKEKFHNGIDIAAAKGTDIKAAADGTVTFSGVNGGYGNCVIIAHNDGTSTLYGHASALLVLPGQKVTKGQVIAKVGSTGNSTGNHLHFETKSNGTVYDPNSWWDEHYSKHANGTKDFGIAGENYKKEYAINKKTGKWSVVDSPTLFDKDEYEIVSEKVSEKIDKPIQTFATGTPMTNAEWLKYIKEACDAFGVPYNVALSLIDQESGNGIASDTWSYNSAGAYGLTQITKSALDDLYENTAVTNKIRQIFADNNVDMSKSRGGGIEHARDNIWVGIGNLAEIKDRYMKGDDSDWSKSLGYYYAGGNYNGTDGKWYSEQVLNRANSEAFVNAAEQLGKAIFDNIESLDENTNSVENSVDTNPFSDANIDKTIAAIADEGQDNKDKIDRYRRTTANAIASDRINGKLSETQFYEKQHDMISTLLNGNDDMLGLYGLLDLSVEKWDAAIKKYKDEAGENASSEVIEALEQAANDEFETFRELINNQTEMLQDFDNQIAEKNIDTYQKWWNRDLEAFDYEQVLRDRRISELQRQEGLTDDYLSTTALLNKEYKEWNDTFQYAIANNNAKALLVKEQNQQLQDVLDENGMTFDIASWFNPDGSISKQFEFDMKDVGFNYGEATLTEISGLVNGIASVNQSINAGVELSNQAVSRMLDIDKQRIEDLKTSLQKVMDNEKDYMNDKITYYNSLNSLLAKYYSVTNSITEAHHNINKELKAAQTSYKYLDAQTRLLLFNENDYIALTKELNDIQSKANSLKRRYEYDLLHAQKEDIAEITNNYERQYDLLMKQYDISKAKLEVEKKRIQLDNVLNERNVRMFVNGQWQWVANTQDVINAQNELEDAKYNESKAGTELTQTQSLNNLSASADRITTEINRIDSAWNAIVEKLETNVGTISQTWNDIVDTDSEYLKTILGLAGNSIKDFAEKLTGQELPDINVDSGGTNRSGRKPLWDNKSNSDDYVVLTPDDVAKNLGITPLTQRDYSKLVASPLDIKGITKSYPLPETTNRTNNNVTNIDNSVTVNGVKLSEHDSKTVYETLKRYVGNH